MAGPSISTTRPAPRPAPAVSLPETRAGWTVRCECLWAFLRRIGIEHRQQRGGGKAVGEDRLGFLILPQRRTALASQHTIRRAGIEAQFLQIALERDPLTARQGAFIARPGMTHGARARHAVRQ